MRRIIDSIKEHNTLFGIIVSLFLFRLYLFLSKYHLIAWDESVFLGMGKWIASFGNSGIWEQIRPPGLPLILSPLSLFENYVLLADIVMFLISIGVIVMTYVIALELYSKRIAVYSAIVLLSIPVFVKHTYWIMTGMPALLFSLVALYLFIRKEYIWSSVFCFVTFSFRYPAALIIVALNLLLVISTLKREKNLMKLLQKNIFDFVKLNLPFLVLIVLYLIANRHFYGSFFEAIIMASKHQSTFIGNVSGIMGLLYYPMFLIVSSFILMSSFFAVHEEKLKNKIYALVPFILFFIYFSLIPHKKERFALMFIPYVAILSAIGLSFIVEGLKGKLRLLFYAVVCLSFIFSAYHIYSDTEIIASERPVFVEEYLYLFNDSNCTILTSDPLIVPYSNCKFYHYYDGVDLGLQYVKNYLENADYVVHDKASFPWNDIESSIKINYMEEIIVNNSDLLLNYSFWGQNKLIYKVNH